ncbi:hypothetical protein P691DRAFT_682710, partial [Macrolepiota fuliginosa MF-IS2]
KFYEDNSSTINSAATGIVFSDGKAIDNAISGFGDTVKVVLNGLDALSTIHPVIGVAVVAFKLVVTLNMTRVENNQKVVAVKIQMQQMMCMLLHLRHFRDKKEVMPDGSILEDQLKGLMEQIAVDIKGCGSVCDFYLKKGFIVRTLKSPIYEGRLGGYMTKFMDYRDQLDKTLTVRMASGINEMSEKLDAHSSALRSISDELKSLFRKLDTQREREVIEYIERNGGANAIVERSELVQGLIKKSGETVEGLVDKVPAGKSAVDSFKEKLRKELSEDINVVLQRNLMHFRQKLDVQEINIKEALEKQGKYIVNTLSEGTHNKIKDPDMQEVWRDMGHKGSVKARNFALALRDYFTEKFAGTPIVRAGASGIATPEPGPTTASQQPSQIDSPLLRALVDDRWAFEYLSVSNIQPIIETIDDDGSGFISIKEANTFAIGRPKDWSLLHWIAFWAKGWEMSLANYKNKIFLILQEMIRLREKVLPANTYYVDTYIGHHTLSGVEFVLRPTQTASVYSYGRVCSDLISLTEAYTGAEEERLRKSLEKIGYEVDSTATVTLITGRGRIERYLFPLLYLILRRHLEVFHYAKRHVVDSEEFSHMSSTLMSIFSVVDERIESLRAIYDQLHLDVDKHLQKFSFGMFHDIATKGYRYGSRKSLIMDWSDTSWAESEFVEDPENARPVFTSDLGAQDTYHAEWKGWPPHSFDEDPFTNTMEGLWTGQTFRRRGTGSRLMQLKIEVDAQDRNILKGFAVTHHGKLEMYGRRRWVGDADSGFERFDMVMASSDSTANKDAKEGIADGVPAGTGTTALERIKYEGPNNNFILRRTPVEVFQFRHILEEGSGDKVKARWHFLRQAILHLIRSRRWSRSYFAVWNTDRRKFLDNYKRDWLSGSKGLAIHNPLTQEEKEEFLNLRSRVPPTIAYLWESSLRWSLNRLTWHYYIGCDGCDCLLVESRFICLTCLDPEMSNSFDLCARCIDKPAERDDFTHSTDHTLIKAEQHVHSYYFAWLIDEARSMTTRLKKVFAESQSGLAQDTQGVNDHDTPRSSSFELLCVCCGKPVAIPFWVCLTCTPETYICYDCEQGKKPVKGEFGSGDHSSSHHLLRLHNLEPARFEREKVDPIVARVGSLEAAVNGRFEALESRVQARIAALETRIAGLETKIEARLTSKLEATIKKIALRLNILEHDEPTLENDDVKSDDPPTESSRKEAQDVEFSRRLDAVIG